MKYKYSLLVILISGFVFLSTGCSNNEEIDGLPETKTKTVSLTVDLGKMSTKSVGGSASSAVPEVKDLILYFHDGMRILSVQNFPISGILENPAVGTFTIPAESTGIYAVGNAKSLPGSVDLPASIITDPQTGTTLAEVKSSLLQIGVQSDARTAINLTGEASIDGVAPNLTANIELVAAVARIEIKEIRSDANIGNISIPMTSFRVTGIYINNTYSEYSLDGRKGGYEVNFGFEDPVWSDSGNADAVYPEAFKDENSRGLSGTGTVHVPSGQDNSVWGYFVPATTSQAGTIIDKVQYDAVPHIILKLEGVESESSGYNNPQYVTIRGFRTLSGEKITHFEAGNYYLLKSINIGAEHLSSYPERPNEKGEIYVTVKKWDEIEVTPEL